MLVRFVSTALLCATLGIMRSQPFAARQAAAPVPPAGDLWGVCTGNEQRPCGSLIRFSSSSGAIDLALDIQGAGCEDSPNDFAIAPDGKRMFVAQLKSAGTAEYHTLLQTLEFGKAQVTGSVRIDGWIDALEHHPVTGDLWALHQDRASGEVRVVRLDPRTGKLRVVGVLPNDVFPRSLAFSSDGKELWGLSCTNVAANDALVRLDPQDARVLERFPWRVQEPAHALELDARGRLLAIAWGGALYELDRKDGAATRLTGITNPLYGIVTGLEFEPAPR